MMEYQGGFRRTLPELQGLAIPQTHREIARIIPEHTLHNASCTGSIRGYRKRQAMAPPIQPLPAGMPQ